VLIEPDALPSLREHQLQRRLATLKRVAPQIVAIQFDQVSAGIRELY
jgi:hypothetical protein